MPARTFKGLRAVTVSVAVGAVLSIGGLGAGATSAPASSQNGYRLLGGDGGVFAFGSSYAGSAASNPARCPSNVADRQMPDGTCWSTATTRDGGGYWVLNASTGAVYNFGDATDYGSPAAITATVPRDLLPNYIGITPSSDGRGYWVLAQGLSGLGSVSAFGDARSYGDQTTAPAVAHVGHPVALVATASGLGYWIVDSDGGVFTYGDAHFYGSAGALKLAAPVVGAARTGDGRGYWLVASDGGVFSYGDAVFGGSMAGRKLAAPVVGIAANPVGSGYWLAASDGGVFSFGGAPFLGSLGGVKLAKPIFCITARIPAA